MMSSQSQKLFNAIDAVENTEITNPIKTFKEALKEGADVNAKDNDGNTPLINITYLLSTAGNNEGVCYEMMDLLLEKEG